MGGVTERVLVAVMLLPLLQAASLSNATSFHKGSELSPLNACQRELVQVKKRANLLQDRMLRHSPLGDSRKRDVVTCNTSHITSCGDWLKIVRQSGVRTIYVYGKPITVYCDQSTDGGGWTVFQRRVDGSVDFYRDWDEYANGFGDPEGNFWLGLDILHNLTTSQRNELRVDLQLWNGTKGHATYSGFYVDSVSTNFTLNFHNFTGGNAGDSLSWQRGMQFSTKDREHDTWAQGNCAQRYQSAWWYKACMKSNLNGDYKPSSSNPGCNGLNWNTFVGTDRYSMKFSEMKFRPM